MATEWGWNPEAVGAIGAAIGAIATSAATWIAVWVGVLEPRRANIERQRLQVMMLSSRLKREMSNLQFHLGLFLALWQSAEDFPSAAYTGLATAFECPVLNESLASPLMLPERETELMAVVHAEVLALSAVLLTENQLAQGMPWMRPRLRKQTQELYDTVTDLLTAFKLPTARNRSVSCTPSDTPESMQTK